ncbi:hypothetical protein B0H13DRAFT_1881542 [Mycena leptocephala]|nr:hypothetical protein B0H13DRAFT_1881542 [Mycena leptocephala]
MFRCTTSPKIDRRVLPIHSGLALNRLLFALIMIKRHNFKLRSSPPPTTLRLSPSPVAEIDPSTPKYAIFAIFTNKDVTSKPQPRTETDPILTLNASKPGVIQKNAIRIAPNGLGVYLWSPPHHTSTAGRNPRASRGSGGNSASATRHLHARGWEWGIDIHFASDDPYHEAGRAPALARQAVAAV